MTKRRNPRARHWVLANGLAAIAVPLGSKSVASDILLEELERAGASEKAVTTAFARAQSKFDAALVADSSLRGVGACAAAAFFSASIVTVAHVGDCRAHLYRDGVLVSVTEDHRLPADQRVITRALGMPDHSSPEFSRWTARAGDVVLLTAVVHDLLSREEIGSHLVTADPETAVTRLVHETIARGAEDDVVAVSTTIGSGPAAPRAGFARRPMAPYPR